MGELVEVLHRIKAHAPPVLDGLKAAIRASPAVPADETGWREDGQNGYIWSVSTPRIRYEEYHHLRAGEVVKALIGDDFPGCSAGIFMGATMSIRACINAAGCIAYAMGIT